MTIPICIPDWRMLAGGGSNGYRVIESYEINPVIEETTDGC